MYALQTICSHFGEHLLSKLPRIIEIVYDSIKYIKFPENDPGKLYKIVIQLLCKIIFIVLFINFNILDMNNLKEKDEEAQELIKNLQVFEVVCSKMHKCFFPKVIIICQTLLFLL